MSLGIGLAAVALCVVLFGSFALPTKAFPTGDGVFFQFAMCSGILSVGIVTHFIQCSISSSHECPVFIPFAATGGALWCTANMLLVPIVDTIGIGMCMMLWGMAEMFAGWATGRFALFGVAAEPISSPALNSVGVALATASLLLLVAVQPTVVEADAPPPALEGAQPPPVSLHTCVEEAKAPLLGLGSLQAEDAPVTKPPTAPRKWTDAMAPWQKHAFGVVACVVAGLLSGSTFTPVLYIVNATQTYAGAASGAPFPGASTQLLDHLHAHFTGIWLTSSGITMLYAALKRNRPEVPANILFPGFCSGLVWGVAMVCWFIANAELEVVISFPMVTMGPGLVNLLYGCLLFREVEGWRNYGLLFASIAVYLGASACVVVSKL